MKSVGKPEPRAMLLAAFAASALLIVCVACALPPAESVAAPVAPAQGRQDAGAPLEPATARDRFLQPLHFGDERWMTLTVQNSLVTGTARRISFNKDAAVQALLGFRGGSGTSAATLPWAAGTVFVAESLNAEGQRLDTEILIVRDGAPDFRLFDELGAVSDTFRQPGDPPGRALRSNVPVVCAGCHNGTGFFPPMMNFPTEPSERPITVAAGARDNGIVQRFLEGFHRSGGTFGPYASMLLGTLRQGLREGTLSAADTARAEKLRARYPEYLDQR